MRAAARMALSHQDSPNRSRIVNAARITVERDRLNGKTLKRFGEAHGLLMREGPGREGQITWT